ncbi:MAG: DUF4397 domain-containing protein [bacterium]
MMRNRLILTAALALLAGAGCGEDRGPMAPQASMAPSRLGSGSPDGRDVTGTGIVTVVHGVPGLVVDVYVNGALTLPSFAPGTVTDPLTLPEGNYDIAILPAGGTYPGDAVITGSAFLPSGANASIVAHLAENGTPTLTTFVNDVSSIHGINSRVVVRHVAEAPTVDVRLFRKRLPWLPVRTIQGLSNPNEAQTQVFPGWFRAKLYPAGSQTVVFTSPYLALRPRESTIVYAIGSLSGGTFGLLVQKIPLQCSEAFGGSTAEISADLAPDAYDAIAAEKKLDANE